MVEDSNAIIATEKRYITIIAPVVRELIQAARSQYAQDIEFQFRMHYSVAGVTTAEYIAAFNWLLNTLAAAESMVSQPTGVGAAAPASPQREERGMGHVYTVRSQQINIDGVTPPCLLHTRSDIPGYGIVEPYQGLFIPVRIEGLALDPIRLDGSPRYIRTVPSLDVGWQELSTATL